jgi:hypothetical protein
MACVKLCKKHRRFEAMILNIDMAYTGRVVMKSETCVCKNKRTFNIVPSEQDE